MSSLKELFLLSLVFLAGSSLGSFSAAWAMAWIRDEPMEKWRSSCRACGHILTTRDLVPVFSWLALLGKCRHCGSSIPAFHFGVELFSGLLCVLALWINGWQWDSLFLVPLTVVLVTATAVDLECHFLPDLLTLGSFLPLSGLVFLRKLPDFSSTLMGLALGCAIPLVLRWLFLKFRHRDALGLGDVKLFALGGAACGWQGLPFLFLFSALGGICLYIFLGVYNWLKSGKDWGTDTELPFGPAICAVIYLMLLFPHWPECFYGII